MLSASFKQEAKVLSYPPTLWPDPWTLENYQYVFQTLGYMRFVVNSLIVVTFTISGHVISGSLVAFGFARMRFPGRNVLFFLVLSTMMIPFHAYMIPRFIIMRQLHLLDTLAAVFLPYLFGGAFYIFLMRQYFMSLPFELDDAARIDGCNSFQIYARIALPLAKPVVVTVVVLEFLARLDQLPRAADLSQYAGQVHGRPWPFSPAQRLWRPHCLGADDGRYRPQRPAAVDRLPARPETADRRHRRHRHQGLIPL